MREVRSFIENFKGGSSLIEEKFTDGYCYYFALILQKAFGRGEIVWMAPLWHIAWQDEDGIVYDVNGVVDEELSEAVIPLSFIEDFSTDFMGAFLCKELTSHLDTLEAEYLLEEWKKNLQ